MTSTQENSVASTPSFVIVPSTIFNDKIFEIFTTIADEYEDIVARIDSSFSKKYLLQYISKADNADMSPFDAVENNVVRVFSYDPKFSAYRNSSDKEFYGIEKKQVFFSEAECEEYFENIYDRIKEIVDNLIDSEEGDAQ